MRIRRQQQPTTTSFLLPVLLPLLQSSPLANAQTNPPQVTTTTTPPPVDCSIHNGCMDCVGSGCAWGIGTCFSSCAELPEMSCYSLQPQGVSFGVTSSTTNTAQDVCDKQQNNAFDAANCGIQTTCEACTSTLLTAQATERQDTTQPPPTCSWYEDRKTCSNLQCDNVGCASPYCPDTPEGECYFGADNCNDCLELTSQACSWSGGSCELNCLADSSCYAPANFPNLNNNEICEAADNFESDTSLCLSQVDCNSCTAATKTDGSNCQWYFDNFTRTGWCGLGGCNSNNICGLSSCVGVPDTAAMGSSCAALEGLDPGDLTCQACLDANCGWTTTGRCLSTCEGVADTACFTVGTLETVQSKCNEVAVAITDATICGAKTPMGCEECVDELKSDRRSRCQWYTDTTFGSNAAYCGIGGCDGLGNCGSTTCGAATTGGASGAQGNCNLLFNCQACLNNPPCVWNGGACFESCNDIATGTTCYSPNEPDYLLQSNFAICDQAEQDVSGGPTTNRDEIVTQPPDDSAAATTRRGTMAIVAAVTTTTLMAWMMLATH